MRPHQDEVSEEVGSKHLLQSISVEPVRLGHYALRSGQHVQHLPGSQGQEIERNSAGRHLLVPCFSSSEASLTSQAPHILSSFTCKGSNNPWKKQKEKLYRASQPFYLPVSQYWLGWRRLVSSFTSPQWNTIKISLALPFQVQKRKIKLQCGTKP